MDRKSRLENLQEYVNSEPEPVSVSDIAEALNISNSYARQLARDAVERNLINGEKSKPIIGYIFDEQGRARSDGGNPQSELRVLPTREALLMAVRDYAPRRYEEAAGKNLEELRKFVRQEVADRTVPVGHAWRFS